MNLDSPLSPEEMTLIALVRLARRKKAAWYMLPKSNRAPIGHELKSISHNIEAVRKSIVNADKPEEWTEERREAERQARALLEETNDR